MNDTHICLLRYINSDCKFIKCDLQDMITGKIIHISREELINCIKDGNMKVKSVTLCKNGNLMCRPFVPTKLIKGR